MKWTLAPDGEEMGHWVDRWLHDLRQQGTSAQDCEKMVRGLAHEVDQGGKRTTILKTFMDFVNQHLES